MDRQQRWKIVKVFMAIAVLVMLAGMVTRNMLGQKHSGQANQLTIANKTELPKASLATVKIILTDKWSDPIPVTNPKGFIGSIVKGYAQELWIMETDKTGQKVGEPFPMIPHETKSIAEMESFRLAVNSQKTVKWPVVFEYSQ